MRTGFGFLDSGKEKGFSRCILISGNGRSGSNRALDFFDASRFTICRSELNEIPGGDFYQIGGRLFDDEELDRQALLRCFEHAAIRRSARDRFNRSDKAYFNILGKALLSPMSRTPVRVLLERMGVMANQYEWGLPKFALRSAILPEIVLVVKLNSCPRWAKEVLLADARFKVLHNIRDPLGYIVSWFNRFIVGERVGSMSFRENFDDVPRILERFGVKDWERLREPTLSNIIEVELWRWRHANESLLDLSPQRDRYMRVRYSDFDADPVGVASQIFGFAGLDFNGKTASSIAAIRNTLFSKKHRADLDINLCSALAERVLSDSPLLSLFPNRHERPRP